MPRCDVDILQYSAAYLMRGIQIFPGVKTWLMNTRALGCSERCHPSFDAIKEPWSVTSVHFRKRLFGYFLTCTSYTYSTPTFHVHKKKFTTICMNSTTRKFYAFAVQNHWIGQSEILGQLNVSLKTKTTITLIIDRFNRPFHTKSDQLRIR